MVIDMRIHRRIAYKSHWDATLIETLSTSTLCAVLVQMRGFLSIVVVSLLATVLASPVAYKSKGKDSVAIINAIGSADSNIIAGI